VQQWQQLARMYVAAIRYHPACHNRWLPSSMLCTAASGVCSLAAGLPGFLVCWQLTGNDALCGAPWCVCPAGCRCLW
jgi:hypothetical protein